MNWSNFLAALLIIPGAIFVVAAIIGMANDTYGDDARINGISLLGGILFIALGAGLL